MSGTALVESSQMSDRSSLATHKILVLDDEVDAADLLGQFLSQRGYEVSVAHDGPEAIQLAKKFEPDMILVDIGLPGMDGYQVAEMLCNDASVPSCRLVALTGYGDPEYHRRSARGGFEEHLVKPVDLDLLVRLIETRV